MSKIIGVTVGTPLPKPDLMQTDPAKGDYVKGKDEFLKQAPSGGMNFQTDDTLKLENGILSVNTTDEMERDNTLPITSAGVYATVGNIEALLKTI
jgi:hypothetical protein